LKLKMALSEKAQQIMDLVKELSVVELAELVKALEEEFGVSAAAAAVVAGPAAGGVAEEAAGDDKVTVEIAEVGDKKIAVIKAIKEILGLGLKEAKAKLENIPAVIAEKIEPEKAEEIKAKLEEAGAVVNLK
jgi:large subunit ribosomal protein L7/L12